MSTEALLYWITRFDSIRHVAVVCITILGFVIAIGGGLLYAFHAEGFDEIEKCVKIFKRGCGILKKCILALLFFIMMRIFIPTTQEALVIVGVGGTIDYLKSNKTAVQLPDKAIMALDKFVDGFLNEEPANKKSASDEHQPNRGKSR